MQYSYAGQKLQVIQEHRGKRYSADAWIEKIEAPSFMISELQMRSER